MRERVAEEVRALLARRKMSASELARRLDVTQRYMSRRLTGETAFDADDLGNIAGVLGVDVTDLFPRRDEGRTVVIAGSDRRQTTVAQLTGSPIGHPKRATTGPATRRPVRVGA